MIPTRFLSFIVVLALLVAANSAIRADIITLADGTEHEGEVLKENGDSITLRVRIGTNVGSIVIPRREIVSIQTKSVATDTVLVDGVTLQKKADALEKEPKKAAEAWIRVAEFYQNHPGYSNLARAAYIKTLTFEPDNAVARAKLGYEKTPAGWAEIPKPKAKEEPAELAGPAPRPQPENELIIGLRRDEALIKRMLDDQAARQQQAIEAERRQVEERPPFTAYGYSRDYLYIGPYGNTYYLPSGSLIGYGYSDFYGGRGYGRFDAYRSGLNVGFSGRIGSVHVNGSFNGGSSSGFSSGGFGGGFGGFSGSSGFRGRTGF